MYRKNAKISALSSGKLDKCECLTGEDLGYKPDVVQKARSECSPLGQIFNKGLNIDQKQEGLLKRLTSFEGKTDNQLEATKDQKDKQPDIIGRINTNKTKDTESFSKKLQNLIAKVIKKTKKLRVKIFHTQ